MGKSEKSAKADESKSAKAGVEESKTPKGKGGGKEGEGKAVKSAKGENTKAAKSGKGVKNVKSRPCPDGILVDDDNIEIIQENSSDNEAMKCYDTSLVTNMTKFFSYSDVNADLSSWDVSSVTEMADMFYGATKFNGDVSDWDVSSVKDMEYMFAETRF